VLAIVQADELPDAPPAPSAPAAHPSAGRPRIPQLTGVGALIERQAGRYGDKPFLTHYDDDRGERVELSYRTFENWTAKIANLLVEELDAGEGARVAVLVGNHWRAMAISFACWRAGVSLLPLDPATPADRGADAIRAAGCAAAFVAEERLAGLAAALRRQPGRPALVAVGSGLLGRTGADPATALDFASIVPSMGDLFDPAGGLAAEALLAAGAGPGGTARSQGELLAAAGKAAGELDLDEGDRLFTGLPSYRPAGVASGLVAPFAAGAGVVVATGFDPAVFWKRLADEKVAVAALLPEQAEAVLAAAAGPERLDLGRLRLVACAPGQPAPALATAWADRFGLPLFAAGLDAAEPGR
jgi:uncharacterized protein (TIGR03089 family)